MNNSNLPNNNSKSVLLAELNNGNIELGEAFAQILHSMVREDGIPSKKSTDFDIVSNSWRTLAAKPDKTPQDIEKLDKDFKNSVRSLAESYLLFIAKETGNLTGKIDYDQYETFLLKYRFSSYSSSGKTEYKENIRQKIKNAFHKIAYHGEKTGNDYIDKISASDLIYALATKTQLDENNKYAGMVINGIIKPEDYAVSEYQLFEKEDNLISIKLRVAHKVLNGLI